MFLIFLIVSVSRSPDSNNAGADEWLTTTVKPSDCTQTMFELISGFGVWNRRYFVLKECTMYYWNHPNDEETKVWKDHMTDLHVAQ